LHFVCNWLLCCTLDVIDFCVALYMSKWIYIYIYISAVHTPLKFQYKIQLEWNRNNPKETGKEQKKNTKGVPATSALADPLIPVGVTNRDQRPSFVPVSWPGTKGALAVPVGKPGQKACSVIVSESINYIKAQAEQQNSKNNSQITKPLCRQLPSSFTDYTLPSSSNRQCRYLVQKIPRTQVLARKSSVYSTPSILLLRG